MQKKAVAVIGLAFLAVGCILGVAGLGSPSWAVLSPSYNRTQTNGSLVVHLGLWENCEVDAAQTDDVPCRMVLASDVDAQTQTLRIVIVIGNFLTVLSFIAVVVWIFSSRYEESYGYRSLVFLFSSLSAFLTLMPTLGFGLKLMIAQGTPYRLSWGFGVAVAGALLLAPGNFLLCQYAHRKDDEDNLLYEKHTRNQREMDSAGNMHSTRHSYM